MRAREKEVPERFAAGTKIDALVPLGPADLSGAIRVGDVVLSVNGTDVTSHSLGTFLAMDDNEVRFILVSSMNCQHAQLPPLLHFPCMCHVCALTDASASTQGTAVDLCCLKLNGVRVHHRLYRESRNHVEQTTQLWHLLEFLLESLDEGKQ